MLKLILTIVEMKLYVGLVFIKPTSGENNNPSTLNISAGAIFYLAFGERELPKISHELFRELF